MEYLITRVSPGSSLSMVMKFSHDLPPSQLRLEAEATIRNYYAKRDIRMIPEFCHAFVNVEPKYIIIITAVDIGYGMGIVDYEAFIVKQK